MFFVSCGKEERVFINENYIGLNIDYGFFSSEADDFIKENKDKYVKWTARIKEIDGDKEIILQEEGKPEIKAKFNKKFNKSNEYKVGNLITVSGEVTEFQSRIIFDDRWVLDNCRLEKTSSKDKEEIEAYEEDLKEDNNEEENNTNQKDSKKELDQNQKYNLDNSVPNQILGSNRNQIINLFKDYSIDKRYEEVVDKNAIKFENENMIVVVTFDNSGKAEGVSFLSSMNYKNEDGSDSYVNKNYDKLINLACGENKKVKIERDSSSKYPVEIYIGNLH
ncbi:TPA: hypothetical protein ACOTG6_000224 [Clostridium perfringens]